MSPTLSDSTCGGWLPLRQPKPSTALKLFCFPHAGGAASAFRACIRGAEAELEVCAIEYPGRAARHREPPFKDLRSLVTAIADGLAHLLATPHAFFGYSYGTLVAFELARELRRRGLEGPRHLFVAARKAPHLPSTTAPIHTLPDAQLIEQINGRYGMLPEIVLEDREMLELVLRTMRADFCAVETYACRDEPPLSCSITAFRGQTDDRLDQQGLAAWQQQTSARFTTHVIPGGHLFLGTSSDAVMRIVLGDLAGAR